MKDYEVIVIGSGAGSVLVEETLSHGLKTALVDKGPTGGTCLNVGCIPTKMIVFPADRIVEMQEARKHGIHAEVKNIDFAGIMESMRMKIGSSRDHMRQGIKQTEGLDFYETEAHFVEDYTLDAGGEKIRGKKIFIASGARPSIPHLKGIDGIDYLTNESALDLTSKPESLIIIGGGYIAVEFGHFFAAMGTEVTLLQKARRLIKEEEPEICAHLERKMQERMTVHTHTEALETERVDGGVQVTAEDGDTGELKQYQAEQILIGAGRRSNADLLKVENSGVQTDERGYIIVDNFFKTSKTNIWAFGDAVGRKMFRHAANHEAQIVFQNGIHGDKIEMDFNKVPHAVFSYPPVASVGMTEAEAQKGHDVLVGKAMYSDVAKGEAMRDEDSFAKIILEKKTGKILGCHIIGPHAPILIQEVINAMTVGETVLPLIQGMRIHPALPEVIGAALGNLREPS